MSREHFKLNSRRWKRVRRAAFDRDGWRCTRCGKRGRLEAHHKTALRDGGDPYDLANIETLCRSCHIEHHRGDDMTPGRAEWADYVAEIVEKSPDKPL